MRSVPKAASRQKGLRLVALSAVLVLLLPLFSVPSAAAASPSTEAQAISHLQRYGVVKGDLSGDLKLDAHLTRAELATLLVRVLGKSSAAEIVSAIPAFPDTAGHWGNGAIYIARQEGLINGYPDGTFGPDRPATNQEVLTILLRVVGQEPTSGTWPSNVMARSAQLGLWPDGASLADRGGIPAIRRQIFDSLYRAGTRVPLDRTRKTLFQTYIDADPPPLMLDVPDGAVPSSSFVLTGQTEPHAEVIAGEVTTMAGPDGRFALMIPVAPGRNRLNVRVRDGAGNESQRSVELLRAGEPATIRVSGPTKLTAGETASFSVEVLDRNGIAVPNPGITVEVSGGIGLFDTGSLTLKAGSQMASGKLTFRAGTAVRDWPVSVSGPSEDAHELRLRNLGTLTVGTESTIQVEVLNAHGSLVRADNGRIVALGISGLGGLTITPAKATIKDGVATFTLKGTKLGTGSLTVTATGLPRLTAPVTVASPVRVELAVAKSELMADGTSQTTLTARLVDHQGRPTPNRSDRDLTITLAASGITLDRNVVTIRKGASTADGAVTITAGTRGGQVTISGKVSDPDYSLVPATLTVLSPELPADAQLQITGPAIATPGSTVTYTVQIVDGRGQRIKDAAYAFGVSVAPEHGRPSPTAVTAGKSGVAITDSTTLRTTGGIATFQVAYPVSGQVSLSLRPRPATADALGADGTTAFAFGTQGLKAQAYGSVTTAFQGAPHTLVLEADSALGRSQPGAVIPAGSGRTVTLRARLLDANGDPLTMLDNYSVTLSQSGAATRVQGSATQQLQGSAATFTVVAGSQAGIDRYTAVATRRSGSGPSTLRTAAPLIVEVETERPQAPLVQDVYGFRGGNPQGRYHLSPADEYLEIVLDPAVRSEGLATVDILRDGSRPTLIYRTPLVDLASSTSILVPRAKIPAGTSRYRVLLRNSVGESAISPASAEVTVGALLQSQITSVRLHAPQEGSSVSLHGSLSRPLPCAGWIDPAKLILTAGQEQLPLSGAAAALMAGGTDCASGTSSELQIDLSAHLSAELFRMAEDHGAVSLRAEAGWYTGESGDATVADQAGKRIAPLVVISHAEFAPAQRRLLLVGRGLETVPLTDQALLRLELRDRLGSISLTPGVTALTPIRLDGLRYAIPLTDLGAELILTSMVNGPVELVLDAGWLTDGALVHPAVAAPVYRQLAITSSVSYDAGSGKLRLRGRGFLDGGDTPQGIALDLSRMQVVTADGSQSLPLGGGTSRAVGRVLDDETIEIQLSGSLNSLYQRMFKPGSVLYLTAPAGWWKGRSGMEAAGIEIRAMAPR